MVLREAFDVSYTFLFEYFVHGYQDAGFLNVAEAIVYCGAKEFHSWRKIHICIHQRRDIESELRISRLRIL